MFYKRISTVILLLILCTKVYSAVFVVTSNADTGPGTLREALTLAAAADSTQINYINFNFVDLSAGGRTIIILSQLPDLSSNLVIDGTSQPGAVFGVSDAKVALFFNTPIEQKLSGLRIANKHTVTILGLYIKNISDISKASLLYFWTGIDIQNSDNIQIGQSGKGNVVVGFYEPLATNYFNYGAVPCRNLSIKSSFFNIEADGKTTPVNEESPPDLNYNAGQIKIGGTVAEGNLLAKGIQMNPGHSYDTLSANFIIKNNKIGVDYSLQNGLPASVGIIASSTNLDNTSTFDIEDNVIASSNGNSIFAINFSQNITLLRNYIGTDKTLTKRFNTGGVFFYWCIGQVIIGSVNPADANYITNCNPVAIWPFTNATINKNSFYCTVGEQPIHYVGFGEFDIPVVNILKISTSSVNGTATPNSTIELFYSDKCGTCSPQTYFASTTADANGNWVYNGNITGTVIASATFGKNTSDFTKTALNIDNVKIINACGKGTGSIIGIVPQSAANIKWIDASGKVVGTSPDLLNVKIGKYKLLAQNGECADSTSYFEIKNKFQLDTTAIAITEPSCGNSLGAISGLNIISNDPNVLSLAWEDGSGSVLGNSLSLTNIPAGSYYLVITTADNTCSQKYGPFTLKNLTGPNMDQSKAVIQPTNCGQSTGSILNIITTGTGTLKYIWLNNQQQQVATTKDLTNQHAGIYKLQVTDDSQCGPIFSTDIQIPETNGIFLDESKVQVSVASCSKDNGAITGVQVNGNAQYKWVDVNNKIVATTADLQNAAAGDYTFTAYNSFGCSKTSKTYHIGLQPPTQFPFYSAKTVPTCFGNSNGSVSVATDGQVKALRWVDSQDQPAGSTASITNVPAGTYKLYLTDLNGCENYYNSYTVAQLPEFVVAAQGQVSNDQCGLRIGGVSSTTLTGGLPPYTYKWTNAKGEQIGSASSIANLGAGNYTLNIVDSRCGNADIPYTILEQSADVAAPSVSDVQLCSSGDALLTVTNPLPSSSYRLYDSQDSPRPLDQQTGGRFKTTVTGNRSFFISQLKGTCESPRVELKVSVGLSVVNIANAFTPNGDGINDYWKINGIENYSGALVQVFTRYGQKVFESRGYALPFDGTSSGKALPAGVYYYIINLSTNCNLLSGSLTLIR